MPLKKILPRSSGYAPGTLYLKTYSTKMVSTTRALSLFRLIGQLGISSSVDIGTWQASLPVSTYQISSHNLDSDFTLFQQPEHRTGRNQGENSTLEVPSFSPEEADRMTATWADSDTPAQELIVPYSVLNHDTALIEDSAYLSPFLSSSYHQFPSASTMRQEDPWRTQEATSHVANMSSVATLPAVYRN